MPGRFSALIVSAGLLGPIAIRHSAGGQNYFSGFGFLATILLVGGVARLILIDPDRDRERLQHAIQTGTTSSGTVLPAVDTVPRPGQI